MINPMTILQDVTLAASAVQKIQAALPQITKLVADIKQAQADQGNPAAFEADLANVLQDITNDLALIGSLFPPATPTPVA